MIGRRIKIEVSPIMFEVPPKMFTVTSFFFLNVIFIVVFLLQFSPLRASSARVTTVFFNHLYTSRNVNLHNKNIKNKLSNMCGQYVS